jgi:hypothetical protein
MAMTMLMATAVPVVATRNRHLNNKTRQQAPEMTGNRIKRQQREKR